MFFEDGVNGIVLAPLGNTDPPFPQSGDLCPEAAQDRDTCMCIDGNGATVPCQDLPPPPTDPPPTNPPPTESPELGCCVEAQGLCDITLQSSCSTPPNLDFMGIGTTCENVAACNLPPPVTEVPTMSQWGLIATAIMLGLFSLITVRRGFRINNK